MSSMFGEHLKLSLFGQSHGEAIGITMDGFPAGMKIDTDALLFQMARRAPGSNAMTTARKEPDAPEFLSGVLNGVTTGQPICAVIRNTNQHSADYGAGVDVVRPGHADYTGHVRYYGFEDWRGGGSFSGRLTAPIVLAGALCRQWLESQGVRIAAHISRLGDLSDDGLSDVAPETDLCFLQKMALPVLREGLADEMEKLILRAKSELDSVGGAIECRADGLPAGLGAPFFDSVESVLSHLMFSIPGVKGISFGDGDAFARCRGSEMNDDYALKDGKVVTLTNHSGGINGGITNGMPVCFSLTVRPTPSIARPQRSVSLQRMAEEELSIHGRHDPCILPRAVPVVEAMTAIGLTELWKERASCVR